MKNKRIRTLGVIIYCLCLTSVALMPVEGDINGISSDPAWEEVYETPNEERPTQLLSINDEGYILIGSYLVDGASQTPWVIKVDSEGNEEWNQSYSTSVRPQGHVRSIVQTPDGGYALTGMVFSNSSSDTSWNPATWDLWALKIDENGTEQWNRTFNGLEDGPDYGAQIVVASDGGFLISGATQSEFALPTEDWNTDYWLIKTDADGNEEWNKTYHRVGSDQGTALIKLNDGKYLLSGLSKQTSDLSSAFSIWVLKIEENGTVIWDQAYETGTDWFGAWERNLIGTIDGGFLLACYPFGDRYSIGKDYWILKCDSEGNVEWNTTFGGNYYDTPTVCLQSSTGDYYIGGGYDSPSGSEETGDMCIVRLNSSGNVLGYITYGEVTRGERIVDMVLTEGVDSHEDIVAFAFVETTGSGIEHRDFWLGKFPNVDEIFNSTTTTTTPMTTTSPITTTTTTINGTSYPGLLFPLLSIGVIIIGRRRRG